MEKSKSCSKPPTRYSMMETDAFLLRKKRKQSFQWCAFFINQSSSKSNFADRSFRIPGKVKPQTSNQRVHVQRHGLNMHVYIYIYIYIYKYVLTITNLSSIRCIDATLNVLCFNPQTIPDSRVVEIVNWEFIRFNPIHLYKQDIVCIWIEYNALHIYEKQKRLKWYHYSSCKAQPLQIS